MSLRRQEITFFPYSALLMQTSKMAPACFTTEKPVWSIRHQQVGNKNKVRQKQEFGVSIPKNSNLENNKLKTKSNKIWLL